MLGGFINWILGIVWNVLGVSLGKGRAAQPKPEAQAAAAETNLATERKANAEVTTAVQAARASDAHIVSDPGSLRDDDGFRRD